MATSIEEKPDFKWIGKSIRRVEDPRYLVGRGGYIGDIKLPGMLYTAVLRSPFAHARIGSIDTGEALEVPGVVAVFTGQDCKEKMNPCANFGPPTITQYPLAVDKVRYCGEAVVAVVAESRYAAEDGVEAVEVDFEPLDPVVDPIAAIGPGAPVLHEEHGNNLAYERIFEFGEVDDAFREADVVVEDKLHWGRSSGMPLDTCGAVARPALNGSLEVYCNSLNFNFFIWLVAAALKLPSNKFTVIPVPAGGSFGSKFFAHKVPTLAGFLALQTGRPVAYIEDRLDHITNSDHHGSDRYYDVRMGLKSDGTITALDVDVVDDYGAYLQFGVGTHGNSLSQAVGPYRLKNLRYRLRAALTNKCQQGAYRGFGSEVQNWVLERMVDKAARQLGMGPEEIRRHNFIQPDEFPYKIPTGNIYDSGNYPAVLQRAIEMLDLDKWRTEQERARKEGRHIGIGVVTTQERSVFSSTEFWFWFDKPAFPLTSSPESVTLTIDPTGEFQVQMHSQAMWGNSPETVAAMLVAEEFGVDPYKVNVSYADSAHSLPGTGPGGSRFTVMIAGAVRGASKRLRAKLFKIAAHELEASEDDLEIVEGVVRVKGVPDKSRSLAELASTAYFFALNLPEGVESGLEESCTYDHPYTTLPSDDRKDLGVFYPFMGHACHIAVIEIDAETGTHKFLDYVAVHDAGTVVNPKTLAGHVTGGAAQGIGSAMYEELVYDEDGQFKCSTFMDYLIPTAMEVPEFKLGHVETPSPYTEFGIKGGGEGGRMVAPAAISAAIDDALSDYGVRITQLPIKPSEILRQIETGTQS
ncbi:MAG: molybdopterin-dependent oxidoreductase [Streptosporangiales bacterium]|nr:molybdopterin-dependent oxidoreductase [Streptosporangiales bacterium]